MIAASYGFSPGRKKSWVEMVPWRRTGCSFAKARTENLDHMGFLKANNLATLLLDGGRATKTNLDRMGSPKANNLATPLLDCERATKGFVFAAF